MHATSTSVPRALGIERGLLRAVRLRLPGSQYVGGLTTRMLVVVVFVPPTVCTELQAATPAMATRPSRCASADLRHKRASQAQGHGEPGRGREHGQRGRCRLPGLAHSAGWRTRRDSERPGCSAARDVCQESRVRSRCLYNCTHAHSTGVRHPTLGLTRHAVDRSVDR